MLICGGLFCCAPIFATGLSLHQSEKSLVKIHAVTKLLELTPPYCIQIQTILQERYVGDNATAVMLFNYNPPLGTQYEFVLTYPDSSMVNFSSNRNLARFTLTQAGTYQVVARITDSSGESEWITYSFVAQQ